MLLFASHIIHLPSRRQRRHIMHVLSSQVCPYMLLRIVYIICTSTFMQRFDLICTTWLNISCIHECASLPIDFLLFKRPIFFNPMAPSSLIIKNNDICERHPKHINFSPFDCLYRFLQCIVKFRKVALLQVKHNWMCSNAMH